MLYSMNGDPLVKEADVRLANRDRDMGLLATRGFLVRLAEKCRNKKVVTGDPPPRP
jgi:hypothetical protein